MLYIVYNINIFKMPNDKPEKKKFSKKDIPKDGIQETTASKEEDEFEAEVINPLSEDLFKHLNNKSKLLTFLESYVTMKANETQIDENISTAINNIVKTPSDDFVSKITNGTIKISSSSKRISEIIIKKGKGSTRVDTEELIYLENINDEEKEINLNSKKISKLMSNIELLEKQINLEGDLMDWIKKKAIQMKISDYKKEKNILQERILFLQRDTYKLKESLTVKKKKEVTSFKDNQVKFLKNFKDETDKIQDKVKEWTEKREEIKRKGEERIADVQKTIDNKIEEENNKINEEKQKRLEDIAERHNKYKEKIEAIHNEIANLSIPKNVNQKYKYQTLIEEQRQKEFEQKEEVERSIEKIKQIKKGRVPNDEELENFQKKIEEKQLELQEILEKKKEEEKKKLFGDKANDTHDQAEDGEDYQSFFYSKLIEEQKLQENVLKEREESKKKRIAKKKEYVESIALPDINPYKAKEMNEMKRKSIGMHLYNSYNNGKEFSRKKNKMKKYMNKIKTISKKLARSISKRKEASKEKSEKQPMITNITISKIDKNPMFESSRFAISKISKIHFGRKEATPIKEKGFLNLSDHEISISPYKIKNKLKPIITPVDIRKPLDKYPDYLSLMRSRKVESKSSKYLIDKLLILFLKYE